MLTDTPHEAAVQREMLKQARRCAQLEMALEAALVAMKRIAVKAEDMSGWGPVIEEIARDAITRIDLALESKKETP